MGSLGFGKNSYLKIFPSSCLGLGFVQVSEAQLYVSRNKRLDVGFSQRLPAGLFATGKFNRNFDVLAMCIFNEPIKEVNTTQILVLPTADGTHQITAPTTSGKLNAMILPAPLHTATGTIDMIDLSGYPDLFEQLDRCFPKPPVSRGLARNSYSGSFDDDNFLEVKSVGAYKVSIAKNISDLRKIDPSVFAVTPNIDAILNKHYGTNFGFVICGFDPKSGVAPHPIGYRHEKQLDGKLFVPTRHEHGGSHLDNHPFDHKIYSVNTTQNCGQTPEEKLQPFGTPASQKPLFVLAKKPFLENLGPVANIRLQEIAGLHANCDLFFEVISSQEIEKHRKEFEDHKEKVQQLEQLRSKKN